MKIRAFCIGLLALLLVVPAFAAVDGRDESQAPLRQGEVRRDGRDESEPPRAIQLLVEVNDDGWRGPDAPGSAGLRVAEVNDDRETR
jgi:hypothetical protein